MRRRVLAGQNPDGSEVTKGNDWLHGVVAGSKPQRPPASVIAEYQSFYPMAEPEAIMELLTGSSEVDA